MNFREYLCKCYEEDMNRMIGENLEYLIECSKNYDSGYSMGSF
jgi:hypothetical protein